MTKEQKLINLAENIVTANGWENEDIPKHIRARRQVFMDEWNKEEDKQMKLEVKYFLEVNKQQHEITEQDARDLYERLRTIFEKPSTLVYPQPFTQPLVQPSNPFYERPIVWCETKGNTGSEV